MKCYDLTQEQKALLEMMDETDESEAILQLFDTLRGSIEDKLEAMAHIRTELLADEEKLASEIKRIQARKKTVTNNIEHLEKRMIWFMNELQVSKIKTPLHSFSVSKTPGALKIFDDKKLPQKFLTERVKTVIDIDKEAIRAALKNGEAIDGAELVISDSLRIK